MFDAYGDESCSDVIVAYGVLLVSPGASEVLAEEISALKLKHGGSPSARLHCRELFSGDARRKGAWAHLTPPDVFSLYDDLAKLIQGHTHRRLTCVARKADFPKRLTPADLNHQTSAGAPPATRGLLLDDKQLALFCAQGATIPLDRELGYDQVRFWPDQDRTTIEWFEGRTTPTKAMGFSVGSPSGAEPLILSPMPGPCPTPSLLEAADALVYFAQRRWSIGVNPNAPRFRGIYSAFGAYEVRLKAGADGGFAFKMPNASKNPPSRF